MPHTCAQQAKDRKFGKTQSPENPQLTIFSLFHKIVHPLKLNLAPFSCYETVFSYLEMLRKL